MYGGRGGMVVARNDDCVAAACGVRPGEECNACGVGCSGAGAGTGALQYVGCGQGDYMAETTYRYVGCGGDFARPRRDFTCLLTTCCLLLLLPLLLWLLAGMGSTQLFDCDAGFMQWETEWSKDRQHFCCATVGRGCPPATPAPTPPATPPPTPPPTQPSPSRPVDPFNCAVDLVTSWKADKKAWCCRIHHLGCPPRPQPIVPIVPILPPVVPDPYNCADGFANWQAGWSQPKKDWCCRVHGKGCANSGCETAATTSAPFDCNAGFANWVAGWSIPKKKWCCKHAGKGCQTANGGCA